MPTAALNPLPSFLRASSIDAGNIAMRKAGRAAWNEDDRGHDAEVFDRLVRGCYGSESDADGRICFIRFQLAELMERGGANWPAIAAAIRQI